MLKQGADFICIKKVLAKIIDCDVVQFEKRSTNSTSLIQQQLSLAFFFICMFIFFMYIQIVSVIYVDKYLSQF